MFYCCKHELQTIISSCKYKNEKIGVDELELLCRYADVSGKGSKYHDYIFSKGGFTDGLLKLAKQEQITLLGLEDLYKNQ